METDCDLLCPDDFITDILFGQGSGKNDDVIAAYKDHLIRLAVSTHHQLRHCPGVDCTRIMFAEVPKPRKVTCTACRTQSW